MLIESLGWPVAEAQHSVTQAEGEPTPAACVMIGPGLRPAEDELKAQILTLQVVSTVSTVSLRL